MRYRSYRFPCEHPVIVCHAGERLPAQIINISVEGARISGIDDLPTGGVIRVELGACCPARRAEVRWTRGPLAGVRFAEPLDPRTLGVIRRSAQGPLAVRGPGWNLHLRELR